MSASTFDPFLDSFDSAFDWQSFAPTTIDLSHEAIQLALQASQTVPDADRWFTYLATLGQRGFLQWLSDRAPELEVQVQNRITHVGSFTLQLLTTGSFNDDEIGLPIGNATHFYMWVQVLEEAGAVTIAGFLTHSQLQAARSRNSAGDDTVSIHAFQRDMNTLLLHLRCLDPAAIPLPQKAPAHRVINVRQWFQDQIDDIAQELGWRLMPSLAVSGLRSLDAFDPVRQGLAEQGVVIPSMAKAAYQELRWETGGMRIYAVGWPVNAPEVTIDPEWTLLVALGPIDRELPRPLRLQVSDAADLLVDTTLTDTGTDSLLYAQVIGLWNEQFRVRVIADRVFELPPFGFMD